MKKIFLPLLLISGLLAGCTSINSTSFSNMSSAYRQLVEEYSNDNILLNVVRTSKNMPMSFLDIPSVIGTGNVLTNANISATANHGAASYAPDTVSNGGVGLAVNNGFTFTQASLDNAQFMQSFLKEIPLDVLGFRGTERLLPRAVSYTLLIESIELRSNNALVHRFNNDPLDPKYEQFQELLYLLIEAGLTVESIHSKTPIGPPIEKTQLSKSLDVWGSATIENLAKGSISLDKVNISGKEYYQLNRSSQSARICVNKFRSQELIGSLLSQSAYCQDSPRHERSSQNYAGIIKTFTQRFPKAKDMELVIGIRSPGNVFDFLGAVLNAQYKEGSQTVMIKPSQSVYDSYNARYTEPHPLFKVYKNVVPTNPAASVVYKGVTYSIADDDGSYTKDVMEFMSTLVTIAKIPGSVPQSPAVVVR